MSFEVFQPSNKLYLPRYQSCWVLLLPLSIQARHLGVGLRVFSLLTTVRNLIILKVLKLPPPQRDRSYKAKISNGMRSFHVGKLGIIIVMRYLLVKQLKIMLRPLPYFLQVFYWFLAIPWMRIQNLNFYFHSIV